MYFILNILFAVQVDPILVLSNPDEAARKVAIDKAALSWSHSAIVSLTEHMQGVTNDSQIQHLLQ